MPGSRSNALLGVFFPFSPNNTSQIDISSFQFTKTFKVRGHKKFTQGPAELGPGPSLSNFV